MNLRAVLTPKNLAAWAGTDRLSALPGHLPAGPFLTPVAKLFALHVGGETIDGQRAPVATLPLGRSLLVCDRLDTDGGTDVVCWPDDSSYHLALSIPPGRRDRWLDIATGSAFAPLLRPDLGETILGAELNPRAVEYARRGLALSGLDRVNVVEADITAGIPGTFDLVTCNAPIPAAVGPRWRATGDPTFFPRLFDEVPRVLGSGGMFVLHAALDGVADLVAALPGERVTVCYVPPGQRPFGIVWWRPHAEARHVATRRELTADRPHLTHHDRDAALAQ
jgi:SAM-dependent methyltransferase